MLTDRKSDTRRGTAIVEFAVVLPILIVFLVGLWEYGRLLHLQQVVSNAAREGGRQASSAKYTKSQIELAVREYLENAGLSLNDITLTVTNVTTSGETYDAEQGDVLRIDLSYPMANHQWLALNMMLPADSRLNATSTFISMKDYPVVVDPQMPTAPLP